MIMKRKIFGIFISLMLMTAFFTTAQKINNELIKNETEEVNIILFDEVNVPIWEVGNMWEYQVDEIIIDFEEPELYIHIEGKIDAFTLEVVKVTENFYDLNFNAPVSGNYELYTDFGDGPINITGELKNTNIEGVIVYNKYELAIKQIHAEISGRLTLKIVEQPYFDSSFLPDIPIPADIILDTELSNPYPIIEFPLNTSKCWGLPYTNFSLGGTIESPWLKIANILNNIARIPGVIPLLATLLKTDPELLENISDVLYDILPVIDIEYLLNTYVGTGNTFEIPEVPPILCCFGMDNVTVPAREEPFEAFNISLLMSGLGNMYYSSEVGNIIKIVGNFEEVLPFISNINAELISYNYNPK